MKRILLRPGVPAEIRAIPRHIAMAIPMAVDRYAKTGAGRVSPLSGELEGLLRLHAGNHRVIVADSIVVHHVLDRRDAYR